VLAIAQIAQGHYLRSLNIAEPCSPDVDPWIRFQSDVADFGSNVLSFSITISPDEKNFRMSGLGFDVPRYGFLVLQLLVCVYQDTAPTSYTIQMLLRFR
jgi:hypothetical protein